MKTNEVRRAAVVMVLLVAFMGWSCSGRQSAPVSPSQQRLTEDYKQRETTASPEIQAKLAKLRQDIDANNKPFTVGYTAALDQPIEQLAGTKIPRDQPGLAAEVNKRAELLRQIDLRSADVAKIDRQSLLPQGCSFDFRRLGKVTPVRTQICGTCWDFTSMGAYEGSYAIRNGSLVDTSEQYNLNCAAAGDCSGGWWMPVFDYLIGHGTTDEAADPFTGNDHLACPISLRPPYRAVAWGFVSGDLTTIPPPLQIKAALCQHGPLATAVMVDDAFQAYAGGVLDEHTVHFDWINHGVTIIGWDDSKHAWLIKNSWGPVWGETGGVGSEKGYGWIAYNTNNIGIATAWVDALNARYKLLPDWYKLIQAQTFKFKPEPLPQ